MSRRAGIVLAGIGAGCGDNLPPPVGPELASADTMFVIAHFDDDMIFMQPELVDAIARGSLTTVYVTSGDPVRGDGRAEEVFAAARTAYGAMAGSSEWRCGYLTVAGAPIHHCRLAERAISLIGLDLPDGGIDATEATTLLQLVEGQVPSLEILGAIRGEATVESIIGELAELFEATQPRELHALDLAPIHGRDHSSHLFSSTFAMWAASRVGFAGTVRWHRGYNVRDEAVTLAPADYATAARMVGFFEACYTSCGPCGTACPVLDASHDAWLQRQYASERVGTSAGQLRVSGTDRCAIVDATGARVGDCAAATQLALAADGTLRAGERCATSGASGPITFGPCMPGDPDQYWLLDDAGLLWNGRLPSAAADMTEDHARCLAADLATPTCGEHVQPHWSIDSL